MEWKRVCAMILTYFTYLLLGALAFNAIERPLELERCAHAIKFIEEVRQNFTATNGSLTYEEIVSLFEVVAQFRSHGIQFEGRNVTCSQNWDYESAVFFTGTIVTTIGYGNVYPTANSSRALAVFYALIGIPLFAILYSALGEKIGHFAGQLAVYIQRRVSSARTENAIIFVTVGTIGFIFVCCIPSVIFMYVEEWSFGIGLYYSIITLTTIGFGDFVAGSNPNIQYVGVYKVMVYFWILIGLAFMAVFLSIISDRIKHHGKSISDGKQGSSRETPIADDLPDATKDNLHKNETAELTEVKGT